MVKCRANWGALPEGSTVSIFDVVNTAFKHLYVIAQDEKSAMAVASSANHVLGTDEIHGDYYFRAAEKVDPTQEKNLRQFAEAINLAMARRLQGTLHFDDGQVSVGDEVISA
jgi:hypothetical protein